MGLKMVYRKGAIKINESLKER